MFAHIAWITNIKDRFDVEVPFPIVEDPSMAVARAYGMLHPGAHTSATVRATFIIDPERDVRCRLQVRTRLAAGGTRIRTIGPPLRSHCFETALFGA